MLYIEGFTLKFLKNELDDSLSKRKISKVVQYDKFSLSLYFGKINFFLSINPQLPICYLANEKTEAPDVPLTFALSLKKFLLGSILQRVEQAGYDRILIFHFTKLNELGENKEYKLLIELMGKHSNIILLDSENKIIDLLKKFSLEENKLRLLMPHAPYEFPVIQKKLSPSEVNIEKYNDLLLNGGLNNKIEGFGKLSLNEIQSFNDFERIVNSTVKPVVYRKSNKIKLASFIEYSKYEENFEKINFNTVNELINYYIKTTISSEQVDKLKRELLKKAEDKIRRNKNIFKNLNRDITKNGDYEKYKQIGDILAANLYSVKSYCESITLYDFYENKYKEIALDSKLSPQQNLDKYYQKYNKFKRGYEFNIQRKAFISSEIDYLQSVKNYIETAKDTVTLKNIEDELMEGKYIKRKTDKRKKLKKKQGLLISKEVINGYEIYYGKNNKENEHITFKMADRDDMWLHIKDMPGSHVIVRLKAQEELPDEVLEAAAILAAQYSKLIPNSTVQIDYTRRKFVKKPPKSKPGFVIYSHEKAINVKV